LLVKEKEFSRLRDELSQARRDLPWERVEKEYVFDGPKGKETLSDLFDCGFSRSFTQGFSLSFTHPWVLLLSFYQFSSFMAIIHFCSLERGSASSP